MGDTFRWRGENVSTSEVENVLDSAIEQQMNGTVYGVKLEGIEGRAGMAAIEVGQTSLDSDAEAGLVQKLEHIFKEQLPSYAQPLFLRFCPKLEMTSRHFTFKCTVVTNIAFRNYFNVILTPYLKIDFLENITTI